MLIFFAILLSFIYFIVFVGEGWLRYGSKVLAMIFCLTLGRWRSLFLVWFISRGKRWGRDGVGDIGGERGSDVERDRDLEGKRVGFKVLAMIFYWALEWLRSLSLVVVISRNKRWGRDGIGDRGGKRGSERLWKKYLILAITMRY